jgi:hypothetical protein
MTLERQFPDSQSQASSIQAAYLDSIVDLVTDREVKLTVLNTPVHPRYAKEIPSGLIIALDSVWREMESTPGVRLLDLSGLSLPDSMYLDFDHLNVFGARTVGMLITGDTGPG